MSDEWTEIVNESVAAAIEKERDRCARIAELQADSFAETLRDTNGSAGSTAILRTHFTAYASIAYFIRNPDKYASMGTETGKSTSDAETDNHGESENRMNPPDSSPEDAGRNRVEASPSAQSPSQAPPVHERLSEEERIAEIIRIHETTYTQRPVGWEWNCLACNKPEILDSRDGCIVRTRKHWGEAAWLSLRESVTAARLAAVGAKCAEMREMLSVLFGPEFRNSDGIRIANDELLKLREALTPADAVSALDEVKREAVIAALQAVVTDNHPDGDIDKCCLESCRKLRERLAALSAPAVPDGVAKGDGDA